MSASSLSDDLTLSVVIAAYNEERTVATVVERVDAHPRLKSRVGPYYYSWVGVSAFYRKYLVNPVRVRLETGGESVEGITAIVQNSDPFTYFASRPIRVCEGIAIDDGTL